MKQIVKKTLVLVLMPLILASFFITNAYSDENDKAIIKPNTGVLSEEVVRMRLTSAGYGKIERIQKKDQNYIIDATRNGKSIVVKIDVMTGQITENNR